MNRLSDRSCPSANSVLVTGGARRIGRASAELLVALGASLVALH
jgi:NAD(P)-dependent dehydrogenase (short-subunit alcohol dehydrogenase family)